VRFVEIDSKGFVKKGQRPSDLVGQFGGGDAQSQQLVDSRRKALDGEG
jgi:hypothetical protein